MEQVKERERGERTVFSQMASCHSRLNVTRVTDCCFCLDLFTPLLFRRGICNETSKERRGMKRTIPAEQGIIEWENADRCRAFSFPLTKEKEKKKGVATTECL